VIFLDFDGTLNSFAMDCRRADPACVARLNRLIKASGAAIVVSSSLRISGRTLTVLRLRLWSVRGSMIGLTPRLDRVPGEDATRGEEIQAWLDLHPDVTRFVILDDTDDGMDDLRPHLVQTDPLFGLTDDDVEKAIRILAGTDLEPLAPGATDRPRP
jgi:hypothetical protein